MFIEAARAVDTGQTVDTRNAAPVPGTHTLQEGLDPRQKQQCAGPALCKRVPVLSSHRQPPHSTQGGQIRESLTHSAGLQRESPGRKKDPSYHTRIAASGLQQPGLVTLEAQVDTEGFARPAPALSPSSSPSFLLGRIWGLRF